MSETTVPAEVIVGIDTHKNVHTAVVIAAEAQRARLDVEHARRTGGGVLRLGVAPALAPDAMPEAIIRMRARPPGLGFVLHEGLHPVLAGEVARGGLDLAVCNRPWEGVAPGLVATTVLQESFVVACRAGHPVLVRPTDSAALLEHPWPLPPRAGVLWQRLVDLFLQAGLEPPVPAVETDSVAMLRGLLARPGFLSFLPRRLLAGELVEAPMPGCSLQRERVASHRIGVPPSPLQDRFLAVLADVASTMASSPRILPCRPAHGRRSSACRFRALPGRSIDSRPQPAVSPDRAAPQRGRKRQPTSSRRPRPPLAADTKSPIGSNPAIEEGVQ
jgi:DNA-binding transcriptional LysR family regulator